MSDDPAGPAVTEPERIIEVDSGAQQHIGYHVHIFPDRSEAHLHIEPHHRNRNGTLHGGLFALLLDSACGYAASRSLSTDGEALVVTVSLTTNYLAPATGDFVKSVGTVTKTGRSIIYGSGEIFDADGTLLATGSGVFKARRPRP